MDGRGCSARPMLPRNARWHTHRRDRESPRHAPAPGGVHRLRLEEPKRRGRPLGDSWPVRLACFVVMGTSRLTGFRSLHRFLTMHPSLALACGLPPGQIPSDRTFSRRFQRGDGVWREATAHRVRRLTSRRLLRWSLTVIEATLLRAKGRPPKGTRADRRTTDREATWGCSTTKGWVWGDQLQALVAVHPMLRPVAWTVMPAPRHEGTLLLPVVAHARRPTRRCPPRIRDVTGDPADDSKTRARRVASWTIRLTTPINRRRGGRPNPLQRPRRRDTRTSRGR